MYVCVYVCMYVCVCVCVCVYIYIYTHIYIYIYIYIYIFVLTPIFGDVCTVGSLLYGVEVKEIRNLYFRAKDAGDRIVLVQCVCTTPPRTKQTLEFLTRENPTKFLI